MTTAHERTYVAEFPHGRVERRTSTTPLAYAVARCDGAGRVTFHRDYMSARRAATRRAMVVGVHEEAVPWIPRRIGSYWQIEPLTDAAGLIMDDVRTPRRFVTKREAQEWIDLSLMSHA